MATAILKPTGSGLRAWALNHNMRKKSDNPKLKAILLFKCVRVMNGNCQKLEETRNFVLNEI